MTPVFGVRGILALRPWSTLSVLFSANRLTEERTEMEYICGKKTAQMDGLNLTDRLAGYARIGLDLGTGDGRFVEQQACQDPRTFYIGVDACRENLVEISRKAPGNALFVIANAETLPAELDGIADFITLNFPWGSLLEGLFQAESRLISGLQRVPKPGASLELRLNESAIRQSARTIEAARRQVLAALESGGFELNTVEKLEGKTFKNFPSNWARRLASGREGQVLYVAARYHGQQISNPEVAELLAV